MTNKGFGGKAPKKAPITDKELKKICDLMNAGNPEGLIQYRNALANVMNEYSQMEGSTMLHEKDYIPMSCCLCGKHMVSIHDTHNPAPLAPHTYAKEAQENNLPNRCCAECNSTRVMPARMGQSAA